VVGATSFKVVGDVDPAGVVPAGGGWSLPAQATILKSELVVIANVFATLAALAWLVWGWRACWPNRPYPSCRRAQVDQRLSIIDQHLIMLNASTLTLGRFRAAAVGIYSVVTLC
jgi:hypothetical protein